MDKTARIAVLMLSKVFLQFLPSLAGGASRTSGWSC